MTKRGFTSVLAITLAIVVLAAFAERAEAAIYLKVDGVDGDATQEEHRNWITVESAGTNISREIAINRKGQREISAPNIGNFQITKQFDSSSVLLRALALQDTVGREVVIHFLSTGSPGQTYLEIVLSDAVISSVSMTSGGDRPTEAVSINFTRIEWTYIPLAANNEGGPPVTFGYDLLSNLPQ